MKTQWHYLIIQFLKRTVKSFRIAVVLSNYHDANLFIQQSIYPALAPIYTRYHALHLTLVKEYNKWKSTLGQRKGETANINRLLDATYKKLYDWDLTIQNVYSIYTIEYVKIFPNGRSPFYTGSIDDQINSYETLANNLEPYASLATVRTEILAAYATLDTARDLQEGAKGNVKTDSGKVEAARVAAMTMQWRNLGFCIDEFWNDTTFIKSLFDLQTLRESPQTEFTGTLSPNENHDVFTRTLLANDTVILKNTGAAEITFYLSDTKNGTNSNPVVVAPNTQQNPEVSVFGVPNYGTYRYLTVVNTSAAVSTHFYVKIE